MAREKNRTIIDAKRNLLLSILQSSLLFLAMPSIANHTTSILNEDFYTNKRIENSMESAQLNHNVTSTNSSNVNVMNDIMHYTYMWVYVPLMKM